MAEIRLTCPECGAEYRIAEASIPPDGRSVECSSCGAMWHQPAVAAPQDQHPARPGAEVAPLNRPLPDSVLSVLREEAELARRQRKAAADRDAGRPETAAPKRNRGPEPSLVPLADPDEDWPATTITTPMTSAPPAMPDAAASAGVPPPDQPADTPSDLTSDPAGPPAAGPSPSRHINTSPGRPAMNAPAHEVMAATVTRSTPHQAPPPDAETDPAGDTHEPTHRTAPKATTTTGAYRRGFIWGMGIAAAALLCYLIAPQLADHGQPGQTLADWRMAVDDGRTWLGDRVGGLLGQNGAD